MLFLPSNLQVPYNYDFFKTYSQKRFATLNDYFNKVNYSKPLTTDNDNTAQLATLEGAKLLIMITLSNGSCSRIYTN